MLEEWLQNVRQIALDIGLDPDRAMQMSVVDFMRAVAKSRTVQVESRSEWLTRVIAHCDRASRSMSVLVRERKGAAS